MVQFRMVRSGSVSAVLVVGTVLGCTNSSPTTVVPGKTGKMGAIGADGKPCTKSAGIRLDGGGELNLTAPENPSGGQQTIKPVTLVRNIENGGWLDVGFWGISVPKFGVPGNRLGYVEVLNIPYCTQMVSLKSDSEFWINRCLNQEWKERFKDDASAKSEFMSQFRRPTEVHKRCTASFTIDPEDLKVENNKYRVRVWTAEHCYQPAYSTNVVLQLYHKQENGGVYVPLLMNEPDGKVWRDKVLAVGGGGGAANDPKLADKILVLRSTDGRTSDIFRKTYNKYCREFDNTGFFPRFENGESPKHVDCFSMTDVATFKGTVSTEQPARKVTSKNAQLMPEQVASMRKSALEFLLKKSEEARRNPVDNLFASKFPEKLREQISINKFALSVFDGMQHARRVRAFKEELTGIGKDDPAQADEQLRPFTELFSMRTVDVSNDKMELLVLGLLDTLFNNNGQKQSQSSFPFEIPPLLQPVVQPLFKSVCNQFNIDCDRRHYSPLDTRALEDVALGRSSGGFVEFIMQRINVMISVFANNTFLDKNHPLRVHPADSQFMANAKYLGLQIKYWLDVMLLHENPAAGNTFVAPLAKIMQNVLENSCGAQSFGSLMFPVMGNIQKPKGVTAFESIVPVKVGTTLSVIPIGVTRPQDYRTSKCWDSKRTLGGLFGDGRPERTIFGVHVNDEALVPPSEAEVNANSKVIEQRLIDYVSSRVVFKYAGANGDSFSVGEDGGDSGTMLSFMGLPSFVLSTHNKNPVNGVVLAELPEPNIPEADFEAGGKGPAGNCVPSGSSK